MTMHVAFELGIASVVSYQQFADGLPTSEDIARTQSSDFRKVYMEFVQQVFDMHMYDEFAQDGWTAALAWQTNHELMPLIIRAVVLGWLSAIWLAESSPPQEKQHAC